MIKNRKEWTAAAREASLKPGGPIQQKDGKWIVNLRGETWDAIGPKMFDAHLDKLKAVAVEVLSEPDPQFDLDREQRYAANIYKKTLKHSLQIRAGLAETLALLGSRSQALTSCSVGRAEITAVLAVRELLDNADWLKWASLNRHLPMLAEAAPEEFLNAVQKALDKTPSPFVEVFQQEQGGIMGRTYTSGLLWALETLAWNPDYLTRVIVLLGGLASIDPGGNWANRPSNSITEILLPWHPQTIADNERRRIAAQTLIHEYPVLGWRLLLSLLPTTHGVATGSHKPKWRKYIPEDWKETVSEKAYREQVDAYAGLAFQIAKGDLGKLAQLVEYLPVISLPIHDKILDFIASPEVSEREDFDRLPLWEALVHLASNHRKFSDADWAMPLEPIEKIEAVAAKIAPRSSFLAYRRLFTSQDFDLLDDEGAYEEQTTRLAKKREDAIAEIFAKTGISGVVEFAHSVEASVAVGNALSALGDSKIDLFLFPTSLAGDDSQLNDLISGYIWSRLYRIGWEWIDTLNIVDWTMPQKVAFLNRLPFDNLAWSLAERVLDGDKAEYWRAVHASPYQLSDSDLSEAAERLLEYGRPRAALRCLARLLRGALPPTEDLVFRALEGSLGSDEPKGASDHYQTLQLIKWLQAKTDSDKSRLFRVEWAYLPALGRYSGASAKTLTRRLADDPEFFCEVIRTIYRSDKEKRESDVAPSESKKRIAENAYRLLETWKTPPGLTEEGEFEPSRWFGWLDAVKASAEVSGHLAIAISKVGEVLPYSPADPDGLWIHRAVAEALNSKDADEMRSGFTCELFNMRGTHGFSAGKEEREYARRYRQKADDVEAAGYFRLATSLRGLADSYERDAERESKRSPYE